MRVPIETTEQAEATLLAVAEYLERMVSEAKAPPPNSDEWMEDTEAEKLARDMARRLLQAAKVDGSGGCRLCRS